MRNHYEIKEDCVIIYLKRKIENIVFKCIIDIDDFNKINEYDVSWYPKWQKRPKDFYVAATQYLGIIGGKPKYKSLYLSRIIANEENPKNWVDHIDHNPMNNRKNNLRASTKTQNSKNRIKANSNSKTQARNVVLINDKYIVQLQIDGKNKMLGKFDTAEEATIHADKMRKLYYGDFCGTDIKLTTT